MTEPSWGGTNFHEWEEGHGYHREDSVFWMSQLMKEGHEEGQWGQLNGEWRAGVYLLRQQISRELTKLPGERKQGYTEEEDKLQLGLDRLGSHSSGLGSATQRSPPPTLPWTSPSTCPCTQPSFEPCPTRKLPFPPGESQSSTSKSTEERAHTCPGANHSSSRMGKHSRPNSPSPSPPGLMESPAGGLTNIR